MQQTHDNKIDNDTTDLWTPGDHWKQMFKFGISDSPSFQLEFSAKRIFHISETETDEEEETGATGL